MKTLCILVTFANDHDEKSFLEDKMKSFELSEIIIYVIMEED